MSKNGVTKTPTDSMQAVIEAYKKDKDFEVVAELEAILDEEKE